MANDVIPADAKLGNAYLAVKIVGEVAALLITVEMLSRMKAGPDPAALFWDRVRAMSQGAALQLGRLGLHAEAKYREMVQ